MTNVEIKERLKSYTKLILKAKRISREAHFFPNSRSLLSETVVQLEKESRWVDEIMRQIKAPEEKEIFYRKFILGETHEKIAAEVGYCSRHIGRKINSAIEALTKKQ